MWSSLRGLWIGEPGDDAADDARAGPAAPRATASVSRADAAALRDGNALFAGRLLASSRAGPNLALSPASISQALSMAFAGARGATASQIAAALDFTLPPARLGAAFNAADRSLAGVNGPDATLNVANALYGQAGQRFRQAFLAVLARDYGAGLRTADFEHAADGARAEINAWVSAQTRGKIPQLLGPGDVDQSTRLVLVNAVYLKAKWLAAVRPRSDTFPAVFHAPGGTVKVPTMHQTGTFGYGQGRGYQALELRYRGGRLAFDILLPSPGGLQPMLLAPRRPRDRCRCSPGCGSTQVAARPAEVPAGHPRRARRPRSRRSGCGSRSSPAAPTCRVSRASPATCTSRRSSTRRI